MVKSSLDRFKLRQKISILINKSAILSQRTISAPGDSLPNEFPWKKPISSCGGQDYFGIEMGVSKDSCGNIDNL